MTFKVFRRGSTKCIGFLLALFIILILFYYMSLGQNSLVQKNKRLFEDFENETNRPTDKLSIKFLITNSFLNTRPEFDSFVKNVPNAWRDKCYILSEKATNITTIKEYAKFDFQPEWVRTKEYWNKMLEERYEQQKKDKSRPPLKVIIVPHSHNDPGWLKTFVNYFQSDTKQILNLIVKKMQDFSDMTFIWSEISFLQLWWDQAHPTKQRALKRLIQSGRFEVTTGGWVMTDEANVHLYPMLDQLIEGHQWLRTTFNITPKVGWSIDPFGHGSTIPYLLSKCDFEGTIIQRIHYAWKHWFAKHQFGDFIWTPSWILNKEITLKDQSSHNSLLTHNMPFDIYSIKHSCGPHPFICLNFDFRKIPGEYTEYSIKAQFITDENVEKKAELLLEQYSRTASLFPHNVALIPLGDDFRYNKELEINQQYTNYKKLIDYINANRNIYNADIGFGTPKDYFHEIVNRFNNYPTLKGDFFVYSDIFSEGRPAYWSGYFTTRPFFKILSSDLEHNLRASEILFTIAYNTARQLKIEDSIKIFEKYYEKIIMARRNLGLFQHHDAITGTSKSSVMKDYGIRLFESIKDVVKMQESTIELLLQKKMLNRNFLLSELEREHFNILPRKTPMLLEKNKETFFVVFNALTQKRFEVLCIRTTQPNIKILTKDNVVIPMQINPVWNITGNYEVADRLKISGRQFEIQFLATLEALSLTTFKIVVDDDFNANIAAVFCESCNDSNSSVPFNVKAKPVGDIQLENNKMRLLFDEKFGFLKMVTQKSIDRTMLCTIKIAAYKSSQFHSGAYLFKTDTEQNGAEKDVLDQYEDVYIIITSGPITSDVTVIYGQFLAHTMRIFNTNTFMDNAIYIENDIDFEPPPKNRETELFMRFLTNIENGVENPEFYSDQNGFQFHKRIKIPGVGIEGNYFPITSAAFIQDKNARLTLLTTHAQGAASYELGQIEVMLDRRTLYDDYRGMGEGVVDSRLTRQRFFLVIEEMPNHMKNSYQVLSLTSNYFANGLRYPPNIYFIENLEMSSSNLRSKAALIDALPCDLHLLNFRTLSEEHLTIFPSRSSLMILHRQGFDCTVGKLESTFPCNMLDDMHTISNFTVNNLTIEIIENTTLTGVHRKNLLRSFADIHLDPMDIKTFIITFRA